MPNPVFRFELIRSARRGGTHAARFAFGLVLLLYLEGESVVWDYEMRNQAVRDLGRFAEATFARFAILQDLVLLAVVPALLAGSIAEEDRRRTLPALLASRLNAAEIILGMLGARLLHVGDFVVLGLPVVAMLGLLGGLAPESVVAVYAGAAGLTLLAAGLSILLSTLVRRPRDAIATAYALLAAWLVLPSLLRPVVAGLGGPFAWIGTVNEAVAWTSPVPSWWRLGLFSAFNVDNPAVVAALGLKKIWADWPARVALQSGLGAALLALAVVTLRRLRGDPSPSGRGGRRRAPPAPKRPPCGDAPMLWKERYAPGTGWWLRRAGWIMGGVILVGPTYDLLQRLLDVFRFRAEFGFTSAFWSNYAISEVVRPTHATLFVVWMLAVAAAAVMGIAGERQGETWDALRLSSLSGREIVLAKQFGAACGAGGLFAALLVVWTLGLLAGALHPLGVLAAGLGLVVFTWFTAALGTAVSLRVRDSTRALLATLAVLLGTNAGYLIPLLALRPTWAQSPLSLSGMTPYLEWAVLMPPWGFDPWWYRSANPPMIGPLIAYLGPDVLPAFALGLVLHAAAALSLTRSSIRMLDATTPRRSVAPEGTGLRSKVQAGPLATVTTSGNDPVGPISSGQ